MLKISNLILQYLGIFAASDNKTTLISTRDKFIPTIMVVISSSAYGVPRKLRFWGILADSPLLCASQVPDKPITAGSAPLKNHKEHKSKINKITLHAIKIIIF